MREIPHQTRVSMGRLLVVDDDVVQRSIIGKIGAKLGYDTMVASSFEGAAAMLQGGKFDVMTLDLSLGEHDGIELLNLIAERGLHAMPIIIISGLDERILSTTRKTAEALRLDVVDSLSKPLDPGALRKALFLKNCGQAAKEEASVSPSQIDAATIRNALAAREISVHFQPKIELETGLPVSAEALARWESPALGAISPANFIPRAEELGLMAELTDHVIDEAVAKGRFLLEGRRNFTIAVNVSGSLMSDLGLPDRIEGILTRHGVAPQSLLVEVTESVAMSDVDRAADILLRLRLKGIGAAIDDFGTGYSSLSALPRLPFSELKIDQSFVKNCHSDPDMRKIVEACIGLGKAFGMRVVAEGIDNPEALAFLRKAGCDLGQGTWFSPALDVERARAWIDIASRAIRKPSRVA
ncbi:MAG: EAL domain-containing response regulator [Xanthobacteraceae bacterium]|nr:EAL domain-containing response regulator [Bradyrhizobium sp.]